MTPADTAPNDLPAIIAAVLSGICAILSAAGAFYMVRNNGRIKLRDAETANELALIKAKAEAAAGHAKVASAAASYATRAVVASKEERGVQMGNLETKLDRLETKVDDNTKVNAEQIVTSNNFNTKLADLRSDFQSTQPPTAA